MQTTQRHPAKFSQPVATPGPTADSVQCLQLLTNLDLQFAAVVIMTQNGRGTIAIQECFGYPG